jgi:CrcB protein
MERFLLICLAGAAGTGARYLVSVWATQRLGATFPYGTLIVNLVGCFVIAAVMRTALTLSWSATLRMTLTVGFLGGFTTYSSFNYETARLLEEGSSGLAALNVVVTLTGGLVAGLLGMLSAAQLIGR